MSIAQGGLPGVNLDGVYQGPNTEEYNVLPLDKRLLRRSPAGITFNVHYERDGTTLFQHACRFGCEGIVSKRLGSPYRLGRVDEWLKIKNPLAPAAMREAD